MTKGWVRVHEVGMFTQRVKAVWSCLGLMFPVGPFQFTNGPREHLGQFFQQLSSYIVS